MKATELRIGNWVKDYGKKEREVQIDGIDVNQDSIWVNHVNDYGQFKRDVDFIKPIPLTEQWLLKFGYVNNNDFKKTGYYKKDNLNFKLRKVDCGFNMLCYTGSSIVIIKSCIKYVHKLQNLYFELMNSELITKN